MLICKYCGTSNPDDNKFCDHCGQRLVFTETDASEPNKYENNPFESIDSETTLPHEPEDLHEEVSDRIRETVTAKTTKTANSQPSETIKRCSRCNGTGKIKEKVPSMFGESFEYKVCPKCHGIGRYIIDGNGKYKDIISDSPTESYDSAKRTQYSNQNTASSEPLNNDCDRTEHNSNTNEKETSQEPKTSNNNAFIGIAILFGVPGVFVILFIVIYIYISIFIAIFPSNNSTTNTYSEMTESTSIIDVSETTEESTEVTSLDIEFTTITYRDLTIEIPESWYEISLDSTNDTLLAYSNNPEGSTADYGIGFQYVFDDITDETKQNEIISNFTEAYDDAAFADTELAGHYALLITYTDSNGFNCYEYLVDSYAGFIRLYYAYKPDLETELVPVYDYILGSCVFPDGNVSTSDVTYITYSYENISFELPDSWVDLNEFSTFDFRYGDNEYPYCELKGNVYTYGEVFKGDYLDFEQAREKLISDYSEDDYVSFEYEDITISGHQAIIFKLETEDQWIIRCFIDNDDYLIEFFSLCEYDVYQPVVEDIIATIVVGDREEYEETIETTVDPLEGIDFSSTPFHGMSYDLPSDWVVIDFVESDYSYDITEVQYADSSDPTFICNVYYYDLVFSDDIEDFIDQVCEDANENNNECESSITTIEGYTVGVATTRYEDYIDTVCFVQTPDGGNMFDFYYPSEMETEMTAIIDYFLESIDIDN